MGLLILEVDGSTRVSNPGPSTYGFVALDEFGTVIFEDCGSAGVVTSNQAEYRALIEGLKFAKDLGYVTHVKVRSDSKTLVNQMTFDGEFRNVSLQQCALQAMALAAQFTRVEFMWIPRKYNGHADRLASAGAADNPRSVMRTIRREDFEVLPQSYVDWYYDNHD